MNEKVKVKTEVQIRFIFKQSSNNHVERSILIVQIRWLIV